MHVCEPHTARDMAVYKNDSLLLIFVAVSTSK